MREVPVFHCWIGADSFLVALDFVEDLFQALFVSVLTVHIFSYH